VTTSLPPGLAWASHEGRGQELPRLYPWAESPLGDAQMFAQKHLEHLLMSDVLRGDGDFSRSFQVPTLLCLTVSPLVGSSFIKLTYISPAVS
jgi:hypothetical protein